MPFEELPKFARPPVVETVVGFQFEPLPKLGNAHLGDFSASLGGDWPNVNDAPPLEPQFERFGEGKIWRTAGLQLKLSQEPHTRLQIRNQAQDRMIQVQNGRFHYNWLGHAGGEYPSYAKVKPEFDWALGSFQQFVAERDLGELSPNQWEVTYVNHLPKGSVWETPQDWTGLVRALAALPPGTPRISLESFGGQWHYEIQPHRGRLHVELSHGLRKQPAEQEIIVLTLTARGPIHSADDGGPNLNQGLSIGHESIVRAFVDLTSEEAHECWGLKHAQD